NAQDASQILQQDGFVGGYELQWTDQTNTHVLIAIVIAFAGGKGAKSWYSTGDTADHHDPAFQHSDLISGLGSNAYGVHSALSNGLIVDAFAFAKGNDVFAVGFLSPHDDVLSLATSQVTAQYARAPDYTIPPDQWPENQNASSDAFPITGVLIALLIVGALAGLGAGGFVMLRRSQQAAAAAALAAPPVALQMSADGMFWYDGARWIDISVEAPPFAPRSPDGAMWWDGFNWRQVPEPVRAP
ncbi:MAG TPA: hypothetical protein VEU76_03505, partial [Candidatus Udaeobacter sp.]|nr:hypothetical protein [Candidatus Udaeobacter sp.]